MEQQHHNCEICGKRTIAFNYGVNCCNACKNFYRRAIRSKSFPKECKYPGYCRGCRYCRFQRCLQAGLRHEIVERPSHPTPSVSTVISKLTNMDNHRKEQFLMFLPSGNMSMDQLVLTDTVALKRKPLNYESSCLEWTMTNHITSTIYMKSFKFFDQLSDPEKTQFVAQSHIPFAILCTAMRSYSNQMQINQYPGGVDVFSKELKEFYKGSPKTLDKCRGQILGKLWELNITNVEFLMLCAIIVCNGVSSNFSVETRALISKYQQEYTSHFTKYCQSTYQQNWSARFADILNVCHTIGKAFGDLKKVIIPFQLSQPKFENKQVLEDSLKTIMK